MVGGSSTSGGTPAFGPGEARDKRRAAGIYDVISETDPETAKILLTQGVEPSFKPQIAGGGDYAPGKGLERGGLYVANEEAFSKGSFGKVRLYMTTNAKSLRSPQEMKQLGREKLDDVLGTENGAVTDGVLGKGIFSKVLWNRGGSWQEMTPAEFLSANGVRGNVPKLPSVPRYKKWLNDNAKALFLSDTGIQQLLNDYNRGSLEDKIWMAEEAELL